MDQYYLYEHNSNIVWKKNKPYGFDFQNQPTYEAVCTDHLDEATLLSKEEAEKVLADLRTGNYVVSGKLEPRQKRLTPNHIEKASDLFEVNGIIYPRWKHGYDGWIFSEDSGIWYSRGPDSIFYDPPGVYCLGERYIHCAPGRDSYGILWQGSTSHNWHGSNFGYDLGEAIRWVRDAEASELGCKLWSKSDGK